MSPRAAWRFESLGFTAYDFVAGKQDWKRRALPTEGTKHYALASEAANPNVATCGLRDRVGKVADRVGADDSRMCVVVNAERIVLGRMRGKVFSADPEAIVEDVMEPGPTTVRPVELLEPLLERMRKAGVKTMLVTEADGLLVGVVHRDAAQEIVSRCTKEGER